MQEARNITLAPRAAELFQRALADCKPQPGHLVALGYISEIREPDGALAADFSPGYQFSPWDPQYGLQNWLHAILPDDTSFYFWPRHGWDQDRLYVVDIASGPWWLFSIMPA